MDSGSIDVVVCTYDNAASLDRCLGALAAQRVSDSVTWRVLVVDNNCSDATPAVLERHLEAGRLRLRVVRELEQGLTPARLRGVKETTGEWVAFVDDDCLVAEDWIARLAEVVRERPLAGAIGGQVVLEWEREPRVFVKRHEWAFAAQALGSAPVPVDWLVGAGLALRREALARSGWIAHPYLADRVGHKLVSGGDVEIALRVAAGHELWYDPVLRLRHSIPARRTMLRHLVPLVYGLGVSQLLVGSLQWEESYPRWLVRSLRESRPLARTALRAARHRSIPDALLAAAFLAGWLAGIVRLLREDRETRAALLGAAGISRVPEPDPQPAAPTTPDRGR